MGEPEDFKKIVKDIRFKANREFFGGDYNLTGVTTGMKIILKAELTKAFTALEKKYADMSSDAREECEALRSELEALRILSRPREMNFDPALINRLRKAHQKKFIISVGDEKGEDRSKIHAWGAYHQDRER